MSVGVVVDLGLGFGVVVGDGFALKCLASDAFAMVNGLQPVVLHATAAICCVSEAAA